jgi:aspartyl-tRNA(Asn)/glutamyl-tRNA(Gln) amidotransferase subunit A
LAGCIVVGKTSLHEFAYGFTNRNPHYGDCCNPWDPGRIPGGSSGGNAVALATGMALGAIGGDTGGSIRLPAALCGVVGLKVTYGRVSRHGGVPLSWSIDTVGPMARTTADAAHLLQAMAGHDPKDPTSSRLPVPDYLGELGRDLRGIRIGIPHRLFFEPLDAEVGEAMQRSLEALKQAGAALIDVDWPALEPVVGAHRAILFAEASAAHEPMIRTRAADLGDDVRPLLQAGLFLTAGQYLAGQQARRAIVEAYRVLWKRFDLLVTPTSPIPAPEIGTTTTRLGGRDVPLVRAFLDLTLPFNLTGQPAISLPCGFTQAGLPIGLQLVGRPFAESLLIRAGAAFEAVLALPRRVPRLLSVPP